MIKILEMKSDLEQGLSVLVPYLREEVWKEEPSKKLFIKGQKLKNDIAAMLEYLSYYQYDEFIGDKLQPCISLMREFVVFGRECEKMERDLYPLHTFCGTCHSEIKERELFSSRYVGCLC